MSHTLLVADESVTIQRVVDLTFAAHGIQVVAVSDGKQAFDYLSSARPDVALISCSLQQHDGFEVLHYMRSQPALRETPVLLMAGAFDSLDEEQVRTAGAAGIVYKPLEPANVINRVKELLGLSRPAAPSPSRLFEPPAATPPRAPEPTTASRLDDEWVTESTAAGVAAEGARNPEEQGSSAGAGDSPGAGDAAPQSVPVAAGAPVAPGAPLAPFSPASPPPPGVPLVPPFGPADAFAVLLAEEQGETALPPVPQTVVELSDAMVERIADRVAERLIQSTFGDSLRGTVHEVSERLVREEIQRIRAAAQTQRR